MRAIRRAVAEEHDVRVHTVVLLRAGRIPEDPQRQGSTPCLRGQFPGRDAGTVRGLSDGRELDRQCLQDHGQPTDERTGEFDPSAEASGLAGRQAFRALGIESHEIDVREPFASYGLGSTEAVSLSGELAEWLGRQLPAELAYEYPTIEALARHLAEPTDVPQSATAARPEREADARTDRHHRHRLPISRRERPGSVLAVAAQRRGCHPGSPRGSLRPACISSIPTRRRRAK